MQFVPTSRNTEAHLSHLNNRAKFGQPKFATWLWEERCMTNRKNHNQFFVEISKWWITKIDSSWLLIYQHTNLSFSRSLDLMATQWIFPVKYTEHRVFYGQSRWISSEEKKKIPVFRKINYYLLVNFLIPSKPSLCGAALNVIWIYQSEEKCVLRIDCRKFYNHRTKSPAKAILSHTQARNRWCRNVYSDAKHCIKVEIASNTSTIWTRWHRHGDIVGLANKSRWFKSGENWIHNIETISETKRHVINDGKTAQWNDMMVVVVNENDTHVHAI